MLFKAIETTAPCDRKCFELHGFVVNIALASMRLADIVAKKPAPRSPFAPVIAYAHSPGTILVGPEHSAVVVFYSAIARMFSMAGIASRVTPAAFESISDTLRAGIERDVTDGTVVNEIMRLVRLFATMPAISGIDTICTLDNTTAYLDVHFYSGVAYFHKEGFETLGFWSLILGSIDAIVSERGLSAPGRKIRESYARTAGLIEQANTVGYRWTDLWIESPSRRTTKSPPTARAKKVSAKAKKPVTKKPSVKSPPKKSPTKKKVGKKTSP
jgi:hypothetical protein